MRYRKAVQRTTASSRVTVSGIEGQDIEAVVFADWLIKSVKRVRATFFLECLRTPGSAPGEPQPVRH